MHEIGRRILNRLAAELTEAANIEVPPRQEGMTMVQILSPKREAVPKPTRAAKAPKGDKADKSEAAAKPKAAAAEKKPKAPKAPKKKPVAEPAAVVGETDKE